MLSEPWKYNFVYWNLNMDALFKLMGNSPSDARIGGADSATDQMNSVHTVVLLLGMSGLITARNYVNEPISCWCPSHFEESHVEFTDKVYTRGLPRIQYIFILFTPVLSRKRD